MFEQAPKNNQEESLRYENENMMSSPDYFREMIQYLDEKIKIEHTLGHSTEILEAERNEFLEKLSSLEKNQNNYKDVA